jgi:hypothetical protein
MKIEEKIIVRLKALTSKGNTLKVGEDDDGGGVIDDNHMQCCSGWIAAVRNIAQIIMPNEGAIYRMHIEEISKRENGYLINQAVGEITEILNNLLLDLEYGLLTSLVNHTRAEVFDDFLDHARSYISQNKKNEAGVIAGVVFEDSVRRICKNHNITEKGESLDSLISELSRAGIISPTKAKRARASAHVRTKATHAQWDEYELEDVLATITFTDELVLKKLDGND